ncbi:hypothetical protein HQQ80_00255 [Microbacteriaceae bacterium VKM Ac-2855]|nr:hypothetical protein [Microbacteriaceae bacterium VKM Ac-2855]
MRSRPADTAAAPRRSFLRHTVATAAEAALDALAAPAPDSLAGVDHLVLLRFAGRSFDAVLGRVSRAGRSSRVASIPHPLGWPVFSGSTDEVMTAPAADDPNAAIAGFEPAMLPVHTLLAREFVTFAGWYSDGSDPAVVAIEAAQRAGTSWTAFFDDEQGVGSLALQQPRLAAGSAPFAEFERRASAGRLPAVSVIEPRTLFAPADLATATTTGRDRSADARHAERLLHRVYTAVRSAPPAAAGQPNIALLVVSAGGGGSRDHRDRLEDDGTIRTRVPAILISGFARTGAVVETATDHRLVSALIRRRFGGGRDRVPAMERAVDLDSYRPAVDWPRTVAGFAPAAVPEDRPSDTRLEDAARLAAGFLRLPPTDPPRDEIGAAAFVKAAGRVLHRGFDLDTTPDVKHGATLSGSPSEDGPEGAA